MERARITAMSNTTITESAKSDCLPLEQFFARFKSEKKVGFGKYGRVFKYALKSNRDKKVAVKKINKNKLSNKEILYLEIGVLKNIKHKNIVKFDSAYENNEKVFIVTEFLSGDLIDHLSKIRAYDEPMVKIITRVLAETLHFIYTRYGITHRDIKPSNVLLRDVTTRLSAPKASGDQDVQVEIENLGTKIEDGLLEIEERKYEVVLGDFGLATSMRHQVSGNEDEQVGNTLEKLVNPREYILEKQDMVECLVGTPAYMAPEVKESGMGSVAGDCWSLGMFAYMLLSGFKHPFLEKDEKGKSQTVREELSFIPEERWDNINSQAVEFLKKVIVKDTAERYSYEDMFNDPWFDEVDEKEEQPQFTPLDAEGIKSYAETRSLCNNTLSRLSEHEHRQTNESRDLLLQALQEFLSPTECLRMRSALEENDLLE
eukprot:snap_masked-scaffold_3-processed-gene-15.31-mRNA-1 protein AED:1.00 eAED:1.00 QI:0/0/0/0/1/1/2/0/429